MKRNLHVVALVLFLLSLAYNLLVWGAAPRLPDVGDAFAASARREAPLAATYMMLGGPLDAAVPAFQGFGERRLTSALGAGFERIRADSTVAMDLIFTLHADHEQNASTSTVRLAGSSDANPFACIAAGVACLWGPAHGGANEAALNMLKEIGTPDKIPDFIERVKDKSSGIRLMGFGHRVYKNYDPRAKVMQEACKQVLDELGVEDNPLLQVAQQLEHIALTDDYFISRKLYPNVDFYSGIILEAIGFPTSMFTALFALARTVGWVAQWNEMISDPAQKIGRPRQLYTGPTQRDYTPIDKR